MKDSNKLTKAAQNGFGFWIWILSDFVKNMKILKIFGFDLDLIWILEFSTKSFYFMDLICSLKNTPGFGFVQIRLFCQIRNTASSN